jgi:hypothetical protein
LNFRKRAAIAALEVAFFVAAIVILADFGAALAALLVQGAQEWELLSLGALVWSAACTCQGKRRCCSRQIVDPSPCDVPNLPKKLGAQRSSC